MRIAVIALFTIGTAACGASLPPPNTEWAEAQNDVGKAEAGGAPGVPDAKLHLQLAQEDLQKSKELINQDNRRAARAGRRAVGATLGREDGGKRRTGNREQRMGM